MRPINERIIESELQTVLAHFLNEGSKKVALGSRSLHGVKVAVLRVPQRHTVMMLRSDDSITCTALLDKIKPSLGVVFACGEA